MFCYQPNSIYIRLVPFRFFAFSAFLPLHQEMFVTPPFSGVPQLHTAANHRKILSLNTSLATSPTRELPSSVSTNQINSLGLLSAATSCSSSSYNDHDTSTIDSSCSTPIISTQKIQPQIVYSPMVTQASYMYDPTDHNDDYIENAYPNGPAEILKNLHLYNEPSLNEIMDYDVIINVATEVTSPLLTTTTTFDDIEYYHIPWDHNSKIISSLPYLTELISKSLDADKKVLVHCQCGVSRSASLIIAYIMKINKWGLNEAYTFVKEKAPEIGPNMMLVFQLMEWGRFTQNRNVYEDKFEDDNRNENESETAFEVEHEYSEDEEDVFEARCTTSSPLRSSFNIGEERENSSDIESNDQIPILLPRSLSNPNIEVDHDNSNVNVEVKDLPISMNRNANLHTRRHGSVLLPPTSNSIKQQHTQIRKPRIYRSPSQRFRKQQQQSLRLDTTKVALKNEEDHILQPQIIINC